MIHQDLKKVFLTFIKNRQNKAEAIAEFAALSCVPIIELYEYLIEVEGPKDLYTKHITALKEFYK